MNQGLIFFPCLALIGLALGILIVMVVTRRAAVARGDISAAYFKTYDTGETLPRRARQAERCFENLLQSIPIFFALCLFTLALEQVDKVFLGLAWGYVAVRVLHALVHMTSNKIGPRSQLFIVSWLIMLGYSIKLGFGISGG